VAQLGAHLQEKLEGYTKFYHVMTVPNAAIRKRMLDSKRGRHAKITNSINAIAKICKGMYRTE
jgi:hypothetical protein